MLEILIVLFGMFVNQDEVKLTEACFQYLPSMEYNMVQHTHVDEFIKYCEFVHKDPPREFADRGNVLVPSFLEFIDFYNKAETFDGDLIFIYSFKAPIEDIEFEKAFGDDLSKSGMKIFKHSIYDLVYQYPDNPLQTTEHPNMERREIKGILYNQSVFICAPSRKLIKKIVDTMEGRELKFLEDDMYGEVLMNLEKIPRTTRLSINTHELSMKRDEKYNAEIKKYGGVDDSLMAYFMAYSTVVTNDYVEFRITSFYPNEKGAEKAYKNEYISDDYFKDVEKRLRKNAKTKTDILRSQMMQEAYRGISRTLEGKVYTSSVKTTRKQEALRQELLAAREELKKQKEAAKKEQRN